MNSRLNRKPDAEVMGIEVRENDGSWQEFHKVAPKGAVNRCMKPLDGGT